MEEIGRIFPRKPQIAYVHEQIFSNGLVPIYLKSKFKNIMIIYETASQTCNLNKNRSFSPIKIKSDEGQLNVIWNSRNAYQNFQKYVSGKTKKLAYLDFILKNNDFKNMKRKLIIDTRRILSGKNLNVEYFALGVGN